MFKRLLPKSLYGRVVLIVILPIFLMQAVITYIFFSRHWDQVTANLSRTTAGQIGLITRIWEESDEIGRAQIGAWAVEILDISMTYQEGEAVPGKNKLSPFNLYNRTFERRLTSRLDRPFWFNTQSWPGYVEVRVAVEGGSLVFFVLRDRVFATSGPIFLAWLVGTSFMLGWIALVFLRNQVRSILQLATAAEAFGRGRDLPGFRPSGPTEVRRAGRAFIAMRERIRRHLDQRSVMLAGVSHDLRTPLTRMKLTLALQPDAKDLELMRRDIAEMERMIEAFLEFANDGTTLGEIEPVDVATVITEAAELLDPNLERITLDLERGLIVEGRPGGLKRAVGNLLGNALKFGTSARASARRRGARIEIVVDDDGPGIPADRRQDAMKPFMRLDEARNQATPGVGLGLSIVRDTARSLGGEISLEDAPSGGLRAILRLPAA